jgi:hypothetical protein
MRLQQYAGRERERGQCVCGEGGAGTNRWFLLAPEGMPLPGKPA